MNCANYVCPVCGNPNYMRWLPKGAFSYETYQISYDLKCLNCNSYFQHNQFDMATAYIGKHEKKGQSAAARL